MQEQGTTLRPGTLLHHGTYRIIRFISAGGFGCTYEAEHIQLRGRVAVKEFYMRDICNRDIYTGEVSVGTLSQVTTFDKYRAKFLDEARAVFALSHPGIVHVGDVFEENGTAYFVMDYIDGCSLGDLVKQRGPLDERTALGYMQQVCSALDYVHGQGRLHLDIKPANIMVDRGGRAILIDFGVSKQYDGATGDNTSTLLGCTPGFAPPEQMKGNVKKFLPATDVYALGATLYKLLTGNTPVDASDRASGESNPPLPPTVSATTRRAVDAALQLNKTERTQSVAKFANMLFRGTDPQPAPRPQPMPQPKPTVDTRPLDGPVPAPAQPWYKRYGVALAVAAVVVLGGLIAKFAGGGGNDDPVIVDPFDKKDVVEEVIVEPIETTGTHAGHAWVDLGLSVKWATTNMGATSPGGYGNYYAWGETSTKSTYTSDNSLTYGKSGIGDISGNPTYDAARANWGGSWRLPTQSELTELKDRCTWTWTTQDGHNGYRVTGPNGSSIFLPAAGNRHTSLNNAGSWGNYWSSSPVSESYAWYLLFNSSVRSVNYGGRLWGRSVRPVLE